MTNALRSPLVSRPHRLLRVVARLGVASALVAVATVVGFSASSDPGRTVEAAADGGGEYHALTPTRILDTRDAALDVAPGGRKPFGDTPFNVPIAGHGGLPDFENTNGDCADDNILAIAVNIVVVSPTKEGYLEAFGKGETPASATSVVNFRAGQVVANTAILRPGCDGELSIRLNPGSGNADVVVDVFGWFSSSSYGTPGARLEPSGPGRIFDSRESAFGAKAFGAGESREVMIRGAKTYDTGAEVVPNDAKVVGVLVNLTGVNANAGSAGTFLSLLPAAPAGNVTTSNLNLSAGQIRSNMAIVPVSPDGKIWLYNLAGSAHVIVDVMGYFVEGQDPNTTRGRVIPLVSPFRAFDTREPAFNDAPLPPANAEDWSFDDFVNDVKVGGNPVGAQIGLIGNLTAAGLGRQYEWAPTGSYVTAYPTPDGGGAGDPPTISNIGLFDGEVVPNLVLLRYGTGTEPHQVRFYNRAGWLDYVLDVSAVVLA
jgi:hypothetical protein